MPLYEFNCRTHGKFEKIVKIDTKGTICPMCEEAEREFLEKNTGGMMVYSAKQKMAKRVDEPELPARRNPAYGIQR